MDRIRLIFPEYLRAKLVPGEQILSALSLALLFGLLYELLAGKSSVDGIPSDYFSLMIYAVLFCIAALLLKLPRWVLYSTIILALILHIFYLTQIVAKFDQDANSTRDDAVELTAQAFIRGENPWNHTPEMDVRATTGPASIWLAIPFVLIFGEINWLAFLFWILIFAILLVGDTQNKNNTFPTLASLFIIGILGFSHTLTWSLDELYFPFLFIALAYWAVIRQHYFLTGILLAIPPLFRLNYIFIIMGFLCWFLFYKKFSVHSLLRIGLGATLAILLIVVPFILIGGNEFYKFNPFLLAFSFSEISEWPSNNIFFHVLNYLGRHTDPTTLIFLKLGIISGILLVSASFLRRIQHPFWHIAIAALLAQTIAWFSNIAADYELLFVIPAFMAVAFTPNELSAVNKPSNCTGK